MNKRHVASLMASAVCCALLSGCVAAPVSFPVAPTQQHDARALAAARVQYRDAALIVSGVCIRQHIDAAGEACYDLQVEEILAGRSEVGDVVHCTTGSMEQGERYLLYLGESETEVHYAEDTAGYTLLLEEPLKIMDSDVLWDGSRVSYGLIKEDIARLAAVISAPAPIYHYNTLRELTDAASEIFIGRVMSLSEMQPHTFLVRNSGAGEKSEYPAAIAAVQALGSVKGALHYGQGISLVHYPARMGEMLNAATLLPVDASQEQPATLEQGAYYLFFLSRGADAKQDYYFPVNPVQGYLKVEGEAVHAENAGLPLSVYSRLTPLVQAAQRAMRNEIAAVDPPALIVG